MAQLYDYISFKPTLVEASSDGKKVVEGRFSLVDIKNANGRIYSKSLWEKVLNTHNILQAIEERRMYGELDHPMDGKLLLSRASHIVTKLWINEAGEVCGRAEILSTPNGRIVEAILSAGGMIGISSRASGTTVRTPLGEMVNEADFKLETFDFVANPSTPGAYPKLLSESEEFIQIEENSMTALEKFKLLEQRAGTVLGIETKSLDQNARSLTEDATANVIIELTKLLTESPELKDIGKVLIEDLQDKRKALRKPLTEDFPIAVAQGSADQGFMRPPAAQPAPEETNTPGQGWPFNPGDEGILAGINAGVDQWAQAQVQEDINEEEDEDEEESDNPFKKKKKKKKHGQDGDDDADDKEDMKEGLLSSIANQLVQLEETASNKPLRAFAAAYLLERTKRLNEATTFTQIIGKLQGKYKELVESGKVIVEGADEELKEKYDVSLQIIEELRNRHRALTAKVYAESELEKVGLRKDEDARKKISETIKTSPTKEAIDEAIAFLVPVKGLKPEVKEKITESTLSITKKDNDTSARTESKKVKELTENTMYGAAYALQLAGRMTSPRSKK